MTRTDVMASSRPQTVCAQSTGGRSLGRLRWLTVLSALLALALVLPGAAAATEVTTTYSQTPKPPVPSTGTSPSKESSEPTTPTATTPSSTSPSKEAAPAATGVNASTSKEAKASTLPFTGFDLRWSLGIGLLLIGAGFSIVMIQRRQTRRGQR